MKFLLCGAGVLVGISLSILAYNVTVTSRHPTPLAPFVPLIGGPILAIASILALFFG